MTEIEIHGEALEQSVVAGLVKEALHAEDAAAGRITVSFATPAAITDLNRRHRGKDQPTDVLSYSFDDSFPQGSGGEVVVCPEVVTELAAKDGRETEAALRETIVHGVLHLLGYEDETAAEAAKMEERTNAILRRYNQQTH